MINSPNSNKQSIWNKNFDIEFVFTSTILFPPSEGIFVKKTSQSPSGHGAPQLRDERGRERRRRLAGAPTCVFVQIIPNTHFLSFSVTQNPIYFPSINRVWEIRAGIAPKTIITIGTKTHCKIIQMYFLFLYFSGLGGKSCKA